MLLEQEIDALILRKLDSSKIRSIDHIQTLWSGYGAIKRYHLEGGPHNSVILKQVTLPESVDHPRGWNTDVSHQRKVRSYEIECHWYSQYADQCSDACRVPQCLGTNASENEFYMVMEDLDKSGFSRRRESLKFSELSVCLGWLANFHATFMQHPADGLWEKGTYWHLETRPDELAALEDKELKEAAASIDAKLDAARFKTLVHGDAKLANFCFSQNGNAVAALDFQYVGGGCGMKDLAYFIGSCLIEQDCERYESKILDLYFSLFHEALVRSGSGITISELEDDWRPLYRVAWADFHRFVKGWSPGHWKINDYSERVTRSVLKNL